MPSKNCELVESIYEKSQINTSLGLSQFLTTSKQISRKLNEETTVMGSI